MHQNKQHSVRTLTLLLVLWTLAAGPPAPDSDITISEARIPMPDGVRLAADVYWPAGADKTAQYPVLL
jgi:predicted acyl esterase